NGKKWCMIEGKAERRSRSGTYAEDFQNKNCREDPAAAERKGDHGQEGPGGAGTGKYPGCLPVDPWTYASFLRERSDAVPAFGTSSGGTSGFGKRRVRLEKDSAHEPGKQQQSRRNCRNKTAGPSG